MGDESDTPARPRTSRFKEHTNTTSSIRPPPDELWRDLGIEDMIEKFNEENSAPAARKGASTSTTAMPPAFGAPSVAGPGVLTLAVPGTPAATEGTFGRFSRAFASVFGGFGSVLGKRKAGSADAEREREREQQQQVLDERKQAADQAYQARKLAQQQGLLPTPKVFVRSAHPPTPRTPGLYRSPSKKDLTKQRKLSKRVSNLEFKLASARKELHTVLHKDLPPVPPLPTLLQPASSDPDLSQDTHTTTPSLASPQSPQHPPVGKIVKKRKAATADDETYKHIPTDSDGDISMSGASEPEQRSIKRVKSTSTKRLRRQSSRLSKKLSRSELSKEEEVVRIVPDGKRVPMVPKIPNGVEGRKVKVGDDGYGGLGHEMF
ncbi:hypothetical protein CC86DRAFT_382573 [Ophiobolus disseminans]|uniref:Uncharacterized protein n=1 Tax=Ophiobolus disseminans TaxID=1469910 RepID=A0A6A7A1C5_9PLEO|nr:hypothetical protein CC86DRAFT_382573 [Ophiobolus disseminans]